MTYPEKRSSDEELPKATGLGNFWKHIRRRTQKPADITALAPATSETRYHDMHRERVAAQVLTFFNAVDRRVADFIGYPGNIREEFKKRAAQASSRPYKALDTQGLDPALQQYTQHDIFFFRQDNKNGGPAAIYEIDCQVGHFSPSVQVETPDGFIKTTLFLGPHRDEFDTVKMRRVYNDGRVKQITTFTPNYKNPYDPPHPLTIEQGSLPVPGTHVIYDTIDAAGNVRLLDDQLIEDGSGVFRGVYSSQGHTISSRTAWPFPYTLSGDQLLIGQEGQQTSVPLQTNIYTELDAITSTIPTISY